MLTRIRLPEKKLFAQNYRRIRFRTSRNPYWLNNSIFHFLRQKWIFTSKWPFFYKNCIKTTIAHNQRSKRAIRFEISCKFWVIVLILFNLPALNRWYKIFYELSKTFVFRIQNHFFAYFLPLKVRPLILNLFFVIHEIERII